MQRARAEATAAAAVTRLAFEQTMEQFPDQPDRFGAAPGADQIKRLHRLADGDGRHAREVKVGGEGAVMERALLAGQARRGGGTHGKALRPGEAG